MSELEAKVRMVGIKLVLGAHFNLENLRGRTGLHQFAAPGQGQVDELLAVQFLAQGRQRFIDQNQGAIRRQTDGFAQGRDRRSKPTWASTTRS